MQSNSKLKTPESIIHRAGDFKDNSWKHYSAEELYWWVKLLSKRAVNRNESDRAKIEKDLKDAQAYLDMLDRHGELVLFHQAADCIRKAQQTIDGD